MIIIVSKVQLRRGPEARLPGAPVTLEPVLMGAGLDDSEIAMTTDTARVFIGHVPAPGDINYRRTSFPYQNIEVLTEASPRVKGLFNEFSRNQSTETFFGPFDVTGSTITIPAGYIDPTELPANPSAAFEYHAFDATSNEPVQQGSVRVIGTTVSDTDKVGSGVSFAVAADHLVITAASPINLYLRRVIIAGV